MIISVLDEDYHIEDRTDVEQIEISVLVAARRLLSAQVSGTFLY